MIRTRIQLLTSTPGLYFQAGSDARISYSRIVVTNAKTWKNAIPIQLPRLLGHLLHYSSADDLAYAIIIDRVLVRSALPYSTLPYYLKVFLGYANTRNTISIKPFSTCNLWTYISYRAIIPYALPSASMDYAMRQPLRDGWSNVSAPITPYLQP